MLLHGPEGRKDKNEDLAAHSTMDVESEDVMEEPRQD